MNHKRRGFKDFWVFFVTRNFKKEKLTLSRASHADENHCSLFKACRFFLQFSPENLKVSSYDFKVYVGDVAMLNNERDLSEQTCVHR